MPPTLQFALLRRPIAVWLALLIAVFGALAPTLSHALVRVRGGTSAWTEVCTSTGARWMVLETVPKAALAPDLSTASSAPISTDSRDGPESVFSLDHCPFCLLSTDRAAPPPHPLVHLFVVSGDYEAPTIRQAFFFLHSYAPTPPPRGPPHTPTPAFVA